MIQKIKYFDIVNWQNFKKIILAIRNQSQKKYHNKGILANYHLAFSFLIGIVALFFVILFHILKPWIVIRIKRLTHERIGHFAPDTEIYLCEKDRGINIPNQRFLDVFYYDGYICNMQLQKMWNRVLKIWPTKISSLIITINSRLPDGELYTIPWRNYQNRDVNNVLELVPPHLSFTQGEEEFGKCALESMGISEHSLFICFLGRDSQYLNLTFPELDSSYHDYRNMNVKNYLLAAQELVDRGYYTIRMGSIINEPLISNIPKIIDYAANGQRTEFMDIYLSAKCHFFISPGTGIDNIAEIFRRPILFINLVPLEGAHTWNKNHIFIPKLYWLEKDQRFMSFKEIIESGAGRFAYTNQYVDRGITLIENSDEEILEVTIEMEERLKGTWVTTEEDENLQKKFWNLFNKPSELRGKIYSRIGAAFIRKHQALLE